MNLSKNEAAHSSLDPVAARKWIGGRGLNSYELYRTVGSSVEPFSPNNVVIFGTGPLNGTPSPSSSRWSVTSKSPLTGILGDSNAGSGFGTGLKNAGFDQLIISGRADRPVYLSIVDEMAEILDARHLWGRHTGETQILIQREFGEPKIQVACIGPAGEKLVRYAAIMSGRFRAAGRTGIGAVMGSKNLKAVAATGNREIEIANPEAFRRVASESINKIREDPAFKAFQSYGSLSYLKWMNDSGRLPTKNFETMRFDEADRIAGETFMREHGLKAQGCPGCFVNCTRGFKEEYAEGKLETALIMPLGSNLCCSDHSTILKAVSLTAELGLDAISTSGAIAFAMDCHEHGILTTDDAGGLSLTWGDPGTILKLIEMIAYRKGLGNLLAEGTRLAARRLGSEAVNLAQHIKGLEQSSTGGDKKAWALALATSTRGADHMRGCNNIEGAEIRREKCTELFGSDRPVDANSLEGKAEMVKWHQDILAVVDSLETCKFVVANMYGLGARELAGLYSAVTGYEMTSVEIMLAGERIYNIERLFLAREGITRRDDTYSSKMFKPIPTGPTRGRIHTQAELDRLLDEYYSVRGWDRQTGHPTAKKLQELELSTFDN